MNSARSKVVRIMMLYLLFSACSCKVVIFAYRGFYDLFSDYIEAVFGQSVATCFYDNDVHENQTGAAICPVYRHADDAVFIGFPAKSFRSNISTAQANRRLNLLVTEQATRKDVIDEIASQCRMFPTLTLLHYSPANLQLIESAGACREHKQVFLPFLPCEGWDDADEPEAGKNYDVAFIGGHSERRMRMLSRIGSVYRVHVLPSAFKKIRQRMFAESKILINIHFTEQYRVLETMRCTEAILADTLVLSETSVHQNLTVIEQLIFFEPYDKLFQGVEFLLENFEVLLARQREALERTRRNGLPQCVNKFD